MEYDQNLPQEFSHQPKRRGASVVIIAVALVGIFLLSALLALPRGESTTASPAGAQLQTSSTAPDTAQGQ